jgi:hypothetical protein
LSFLPLSVDGGILVVVNEDMLRASQLYMYKGIRQVNIGSKKLSYF